MRAMVLNRPKVLLQLRDVPKPQPATGQLLVRVSTCAVCRTDLHIIDGIVNLAGTLTVLGAWMSGLFDNYIVDGLINAASNATLGIGGRLRRLQTGFVRSYALSMLAGTAVVLAVLLAVRFS